MTKIFFILLFAAFSQTTTLGQTTTIKVKKDKKQSADTLNLLQGVWHFEFISILNKEKSSESYYATDLEIDKDKFIMRLSEAAQSGQIITKNNRLMFVFDTKWCKDTAWCKDMTIYDLNKKRLVLLKKQAKTESYFNNQKGYQDILFYYKR